MKKITIKIEKATIKGSLGFNPFQFLKPGSIKPVKGKGSQYKRNSKHKGNKDE